MPKLKKYLSWFFNDSASVLGCRSNYFSLINTSYGSVPSTDNSALLGSLSKIGQHRKILQALQTLDRSQYRQLSALYLEEYQHQYPMIIKQVFQEKTGLAFTLFYNLEELLQLCTKHRHQSLSKEEEKALQQLISLTELTYQKLHKQLQYHQCLQGLR